MCKCQRNTLALRRQIDCFLQAGFSIQEIARLVGYNKTSIYRKLRTNMGTVPSLGSCYFWGSVPVLLIGLGFGCLGVAA